MGESTRPILPLPPKVASLIKSCTAVSSLASVALGLVANSLDAKARKIDVSIDFVRGAVAVEDDGIGIPPREFSVDGGLGKPYHTSKYNSLDPTVGSKGTFLASVAALSILTIVSHHRDCVHHASLTLHHSRPAARLIPAPAQQYLSNREHGTRVSVQDLFGNMPVRVKQRALEPTNGEAGKQYESVKKQLAGLLLAWHLPVSLCVKITGNKKEMRVRGKDMRLSDGERDLSIKTVDLTLVCGILSQLGYIEHSEWAGWIKTSARTPFIAIRGAISLQPAPSKQAQFISLGRRPIYVQKDGNVLYEEVNRVFASSSFGNDEASGGEAARKAKTNKDRRYKQNGYTNKQLKGGGKGVDRWPMFYIRIDMQSADRGGRLDVENLGEGTLTGLLKVLGAMLTGFLDEHHFGPRARAGMGKCEAFRSKEMAERHLSSSIDVNSPSKTVLKHQDDTFAVWGRIKSGSRVKSSALSPCVSSAISQPSPSEKGIPETPDLQIEQNEAVQPSETVRILQNEPRLQQYDKAMEWINPTSGAAVLINTRTGLVVGSQESKRPASASVQLSSLLLPLDTKCNDADYSKRLTQTALSSQVEPSAASWSRDLLKTWKNPVFGITEEAIPQVSFEGPSLDMVDILHGRHHCCSDADIQKAFTQCSTSLSTRLSRQALKGATTIAQVDQKFVLISMSAKLDTDGPGDDARELLVLVDQHAADERIRVEGLLADLASPPTPLAKPVTFEIAAREDEILTRQIPYFTSWGIVYNITALPNSPKCRLTVKALPAAIAERCRIEPKLLIELLRGEGWRREELAISCKAVPSSLSAKDEDWLARLSSCPPGLLDMLNSRACRSAIMFNDELSMAECTTLVQRLAECAFPFQCAHGRPSMVPVVDVGTASMRLGVGGEGLATGYAGTDGMEKTFGEAWKEWRPKGHKHLSRKHVALE